VRRISCIVLLATCACRDDVALESSRESPQPQAPAIEREPASTSEPPPKPQVIAREFNWSVPSCPLTYHYLARLGNDMSEIRLEFDVVMSARGTGVSLHGREFELSQTLDGKPFGQPTVEPEGVFADVYLEVGDGVWTEIDGITRLWSANQSAPGLMLMWPALPAQPSTGATMSWTLPDNRYNPEVVRTEATRLSEKLPDDWDPGEYEQPPPTTATVTLESWESEGAGKKAVLVVDHEEPLTLPEELGKASARVRGRYEVLDSGRLVRADVTIEFRNERTSVASTAEFRLIDACADASPGPAKP
jgi:hypothetical protein